ncbi:MAG: hypothetical protein ACRDTR_06750 [Rubrobacter sp.]
MGLIRTILALVILLILVHVGLVYTGFGQGNSVVINAVFSLARLLESPAAFLLAAVPALQQYLDPNNFFAVALLAAALYFVLYLLLGVGRRG